MKIIVAAAKWIFILVLPVMLLTASISVALNSLCLYTYGFEKYDIRQTTGLADAELERAASGLIEYFNSGEEYIDVTVVKDGKSFPLFNQREVLHLKDVKDLFRLNYLVLLVTLIYALAYAGVSLFWRRRKYRRQLARAVVWGSGITLGLMLLLGLGAMLNFEQLFWQFHLISFANDFWQLDPARDYLIMLFPGGFWLDATLFIALGTVAGAVILGGVGGRWLVFSRR